MGNFNGTFLFKKLLLIPLEHILVNYSTTITLSTNDFAENYMLRPGSSRKLNTCWNNYFTNFDPKVLKALILTLVS